MSKHVVLIGVTGHYGYAVTQESEVDSDSWAQFASDLTNVLRHHSGRALAAKTFWGRTTVNEIKGGRQLPTEKQLLDLLTGAGIEAEVVRQWSNRYQALGDVPRSTAEAHLPRVDDREQASDSASGATQTSVESDGRQLIRRWWWIVAVLAVAILLACAFAFLLPRSGPPIPTSSPTAAVGSTSTPSPEGRAGSITSPTDKVTASSSAGVHLRGIVRGATAGTIWLLDRDHDGSYAADTSVDVGSTGTWAAEDSPIGDPDDIPSNVQILLVYADDACAAFLRMKASADDSTFDGFPRGCQLLDRVTVTIDRP